MSHAPTECRRNLRSVVTFCGGIILAEGSSHYNLHPQVETKVNYSHSRYTSLGYMGTTSLRRSWSGAVDAHQCYNAVDTDGLLVE